MIVSLLLRWLLAVECLRLLHRRLPFILALVLNSVHALKYNLPDLEALSDLQAFLHIHQDCIPEQLSAALVLVLHIEVVGSKVVVAIEPQEGVSRNLLLVSM